MIEQALLNGLKAEQQAYSLQALSHPNLKTEFEYGFRCGVNAGLEKAVEILLAMLKDERDNDRDL
jgi:hypothetical protein